MVNYPIALMYGKQYARDCDEVLYYIEQTFKVSPEVIYESLKEFFQEEEADSLDTVKQEFRAYECYVDEVNSEVNGLFDELEVVCDYLESGKRGKTKDVIAADIRRLMRNCRSNLRW